MPFSVFGEKTRIVIQSWEDIITQTINTRKKVENITIEVIQNEPLDVLSIDPLEIKDLKVLPAILFKITVRYVAASHTVISLTFNVSADRIPDMFTEILLQDIIEDEFNLPNKYIDIPMGKIHSSVNFDGEFSNKHKVEGKLLITSNLPKERFINLNRKVHIFQEELDGYWRR